MGDMPTPTKEKIGRSIVQNAMEKVHFDPGTTYSDKLIGYADLLESLHFIQNFGVGRHAQRVRVKMTLRLLKQLDNEEDKGIKKAVYSTLNDLNQGDFEI